MGKKVKKPIEALQPDGSSGLARALGSNDPITREAGLQAMTIWLSKRNINENDLLRLWKAIFFCFWHSDLGPVQTALADRLSEIMLQLPEDVGDLYFRAFVRTMRREWFGIDHLRLDKYLMFIRKFYTQHLRSLQNSGWNSEKIEEAAEYWLSEALVPEDNLVAGGFAYHICDIFLPQLSVVVGEAGGKGLDNDTLCDLIEPFCTALASTNDKALIHRMKQGLFDPLLDEIANGSDVDVWQKLNVAQLAAGIFDLGAEIDTKAKNREVLYGLSKALELADKKRTARRENSKSKKKAKKEQVMANGNGAAAAKEEKPTSAPKQKKRKAAEQEQPEEQPSPPAVVTVEEQPGKKAKKNKKKSSSPNGFVQLEAALASVAAKKSAPVNKKDKNGGEPSSSDKSQRRKSVRFSLKDNLVMTIGGKVPDVTTRTPPRAQPKGPALKKKSTLGRKEPGGSAPGRLQQRFSSGMASASKGKKHGSSKTPMSVPRARAHEFF